MNPLPPPETGPRDALRQLALDIRWSWNHSTDKLWQRLDPELWELTDNPWVVLQTVSRSKLESVSSDPEFQAMLDELAAENRAIREQPRWFQQTHPDAPLQTIAYFSMEYMLSEGLPIYSGGLGNVAGDQLKAAHDLGVPVVAVGLLYQQGYFRQAFDRNGAQIALYPFNDPGQLPIRRLRDEAGEWLRLRLALPGFEIWIRTWEVQVGRNRLLLLDTNDPANLPQYRGIASELYGGGPELRLLQEMLLGIAGWRLLRELGIHPEVCHLNEGHAAFAVLERARAYMQDSGHPFPVALEATRAGNLFTTHTPVEAGFDRFAPDLMAPFLRHYAEHELRIPFRDLLALGRRNPDDDSEPFNMAYLAMRGSGAVNGVSRLHGEVSRRIFQPLFPRWPQPEVPVGHVTNGVHVPTWDSVEADTVWTNACGKARWSGDQENLGDLLRCVDDRTLWNMRNQARGSLIEYARERYAREISIRVESPVEIAAAAHVFDFHTLTLGFARRFATYKRPNLLLRDPDRLVRILTNPHRPAQFIVAGKAHPRDWAGQQMIRQWNDFVRRPEVRGRVIFLSDYDMLLTQRMAAGIDLWINTPRRPWEASGTSGMKVLVNGGLNLSELDGWWAEAYAPEVGWAIGDGREHDEDPAWDAREAEELYNLLEQEIVPAFYDSGMEGVPVRWIARIRESMARLTPAFSANRTVREYTGHYVAAAGALAERTAAQGRLAAELAQWREGVARHWKEVRFGPVEVMRRDGDFVFRVRVDFGLLDPGSARVELYANDRAPVPMSPDAEKFYTARVPATRDPSIFTPRVIPYHAKASVPLEANQILWQK
ncbi:MAG TPA: alpha-glucan family phosphorylase [Bryobacteraceae bacterium]|nr:alpha-glucan family phosphorylase [Bryobacteraceae bacterium]